MAEVASQRVEFHLTVESRLGPKRVFGLTPGKLLTLKFNFILSQIARSPSAEITVDHFVSNPLRRFDGSVYRGGAVIIITNSARIHPSWQKSSSEWLKSPVRAYS